MQSGAFEPEDLFRRGGLFSSLIGFKKKTHKVPPSRQTSIDQSTSVCSTSREEPRALQPLPQISLQVAEEQTPIAHQPPKPEERTPFDIYREIVSEVECFQRSSTATPISDFSTHSPCSISPQLPPPHPNQMDPMMSPEALAPHQSYQDPNFFPSWSHLLPPSHPHLDQSMTIQNYQQCPFMQKVSSLDAPPAYPGMVPSFPQEFPGASKVPPMIIPSNPLPYSFPPPQPYPLLDVKSEPLEAKLLNALQTQATMEEFVKLVVSAVKKEEAQSQEDERPEVILHRKRQQNNAAAARYRKRQREAKQQADGELQDLLDRNRELRGTVERMELEIELLKRAVLAGRDPSE